VITAILPSFIRHIGEGCFQNAHLVRGVQFTGRLAGPEQPKSIFSHRTRMIEAADPSCLCTIRDMAFRDAPRLSSICIPPTVTVLGNECFAGCPCLSDVTFALGSQLAQVGQRAFADCTALVRIRIPAAVAVLGLGCFARCSALAEMTIEPGSTLRRIEESVFSSAETAVPDEGTRVAIIFEEG
jgi:hypothetical protein